MPKKIIKEETSITLPDEASVAITINKPEDMPRAVSILSVLNKALDALIADREKITATFSKTKTPLTGCFLFLSGLFS